MDVKKLRLDLRAPTTFLFLKVFVFGGLLLILSLVHSFWWQAAFGGYVVFLFLNFFGDKKLRICFLLFSLLSVLAVGLLTGSFWSVFLIIFLSFLLFLLLGVKILVFSQIKSVLGIFFYFLVFLLLVVFSGNWFSANFPLKTVVFFFLFYLVLKEYSSFVLGVFDGRKKIYLLAVSFLTAQLLWTTSLLSVGFLNAASLVLVFLIASLDVLFHHFLGELNFRVALKNIVFFGFFSSMILLLPVIIF